jgi:hypothetical protein
MDLRLARLAAPVRLALAAFVLLILGFQVLAQANLWERDGGGRLPGPDEVLWKYHGRPRSSRLHQVLDPARPREDPRAMWPFLDPSGAEAAIAERRDRILGWVERGAPESEWALVQPVFTAIETCGGCHAAGGSRQDLPFETYADVLPVTEPDRGMRLADLLVSAHNHAFAFAVLALLLSVAVAFTGLPGRLKSALVLGAFAGAALDVGCWFLTRSHGEPWNLGVILGGGLFGASTLAMSLAVLDEVATGGRAARLFGGRRAAA